MTGECRTCGRHITIENGCDVCAYKAALAFGASLVMLAAILVTL